MDLDYDHHFDPNRPPSGSRLANIATAIFVVALGIAAIYLQWLYDFPLN